MADETKLAVGGFAIFNGYSSELEEGVTPALAEGDAVKIMKDDRNTDDGGWVVAKVDPDTGTELTKEGEGGTQVVITERCFDEELTPAELKTDETPTEATAPKRGRTKATTDKEPEAAEPAAEDTETKATGKAKTKAEATGKSKATDTKAKETTPAKAAEPAPPTAPVFVDVPSVKKLLENTDALKAAETLVSQREATDFTLGGVLHNIHETGIYKQLGFDGKRGFDDYVEQHLGVAGRKARYLMANYVTFASLGVDTDKLESIGWSKAKELARIPAEQLKKDYDKLVKLAGEKTRDELTAHITKKYTVVTRGQSIKTTSLSFRFAEENGETVKQALAQAKPMAGENADDNAALLYICNDFLTGGPGSDMTLSQMTDLIETTFGVTVTIANSEGETVDPATYVPEDTAAEADQEMVPA
jgi:hypothetical protein